MTSRNALFLMPPLLVPEPEVLLKYGKLALVLTRLARKKAKKKGREHREWMLKNCS